jgi:serine/threonine-protein kinase
VTIDVGDVVGGYHVLASLGAGGVGRVYKVRHAITGRIEALKILLPDYAHNEEQAERFLREVKVQANLNHPNIASVHNAFRVGRSLLMVMEFVEGESLDRVIARGRLPLRQALDYAAQALSALSYAHGRGVVHRDVKPENMLVTPAGTLKVTDFGLAKTTTDIRLTVTGATLGSLYYMSPEQVNGATDLDKRADIYSMGAVLFELVTGRRPFDGAQPFQLMLAHVEQPPKAPAELDPSLPPSLNDAILKALQKQPEARFESAEQFLAALEAAAAHSGGVPSNRSATVPRETNRQDSGNGHPPARGEPASNSASRETAPRRVRPAQFLVKRTLLGLSLVALVASLAVFFAWRALRPDPAKTVATSTGNHRLLRKVIPEAAVQAIVFNATGDLAAVLTSKGRVEVWEPESGEKRATFSGAGKRSHALALSPDGGTLVFADSGSQLRLWNTATGEEQLRLDAGGAVRSVAMSGDGALLAAVSGRTLTVWDIASARQEAPIHHQEFHARLVAFRPDGAALAAADEAAVHVQPLRQPGEPARLQASEGGATVLAFDPESGVLAAAGSGVLTVWNSKTLEEVQSASLPGEAFALGFTRSGHCLALTSNGSFAQIWDSADRAEVSGFLHGYDVGASALSAGGRLAATATAAGDLWFWKADQAWDQPIEPPNGLPQTQRKSEPQSKPRKNVFRRLADVFRGRK